MRKMIVAVAALGLVGCKGEGNTASAADCASVCGQQTGSGSSSGSSAAGLSSFEQGLVGPVLEQVREGVQPWSGESIGICRGRGRDCEEFMGENSDELPPGEYMVRAELKVPRVGEKGTWRVRFETECTTTRTTERGESTTTSSYSKEYDVQYVGQERGSRLSPLTIIKSPEPSGSKSCTYKLTSLHPDKPTQWTGSWSVPQG